MNYLNEQEHDITKKMLDTMRNGSPKNRIIESEEDITKKMLETIRSKKQLITEEDYVQGVGQQTLGANTVPASAPSQPSEAEDLSPDLLKKEQKAFMDSVSPKIDFRGFKIYRKDRNVVFSGAFQDLGGMEWVMSLKDADGLTVTAQTLKIDNDSIGILNKLYGYYVNWSKEWSLKMNTEYKLSDN